MNSQYYNLQANSAAQNRDNDAAEGARYGQQYGETKTVYSVPTHFKLSEIQANQREQAMKEVQDKGKQYGGLRLDPAQLKHLKPETVSIYQVPTFEKPKPARP